MNHDNSTAHASDPETTIIWCVFDRAGIVGLHKTEKRAHDWVIEQWRNNPYNRMNLDLTFRVVPMKMEI